MDNLKLLSREFKNGKYELNDTGIFLPKARIQLGGVFGVEHYRKGELLFAGNDPNIVVNQGLDHALSVIFNGGAQIATWFVGLFEGNYTPVATDTAANIAANATECTAYDETVRQTWVEAAPSGQSITNSASKATFTMNATKTVYGAFLVSLNTKGGTTGTLFAASKFSAARNVVDDDQLLVTYTLTAADA